LLRFACLLYPGKLNTSLCIYWPFKLLPLRIPCLIHVPISSLQYWFFVCSIFLIPCRFLILVPYQVSGWQRFFSGSPGCLLSRMTGVFGVQKLFSLMQSHFFFLSLRCWAFWVLLRKLFSVHYVPMYFLLFPGVVSTFQTFYSS
jgi:hypothetical protein